MADKEIIGTINKSGFVANNIPDGTCIPGSYLYSSSTGKMPTASEASAINATFTNPVWNQKASNNAYPAWQYLVSMSCVTDDGDIVLNDSTGNNYVTASDIYSAFLNFQKHWYYPRNEFLLVDMLSSDYISLVLEITGNSSLNDSKQHLGIALATNTRVFSSPWASNTVYDGTKEYTHIYKARLLDDDQELWWSEKYVAWNNQSELDALISPEPSQVIIFGIFIPVLRSNDIFISNNQARLSRKQYIQQKHVMFGVQTVAIGTGTFDRGSVNRNLLKLTITSGEVPTDVSQSSFITYATITFEKPSNNVLTITTFDTYGTSHISQIRGNSNGYTTGTFDLIISAQYVEGSDGEANATLNPPGGGLSHDTTLIPETPRPMPVRSGYHAEGYVSVSLNTNPVTTKNISWNTL